MALRKTVLFSSPLGTYGGRMRYAPTNWVRTILRNTDAISQLDTCGPSKNCPVFVPFEAVYEAYSIRLYNWVCAILQNTDIIPQPDTYGPSKNCPVFVTFGAACGAYSIRPYNWVCVRVQKIDLYFLPSVASGEHMRYAPPTGYMQSFEIPMRSLDRRGEGVWEVGW